MIYYFRELRLLPIAVVASACLLALVAADLLLGRQGATPPDDGPLDFAETTVVHAGTGDRRPADPNRSWAQQMFNFPGPKTAPPETADVAFLPAIPPLAGDKNDKNNRNNPDITGSVNAPAEKEKPKGEGGGAAVKEAANKEAANKEVANKDAAKGPKDPPPSPDGTVVPLVPTPGPSAAERAILERLQERRQELDKRARELDIREGLIAEAERRVDSKLAEIKEGQAQLAAAEQKRDEVEAARFKGLVTMYETMKPRDAAKIFDRLDVGVLLKVASQINPRNMSEIMAQMSPDRAEQLTVELANRAQAATKNAAANLPKIEGRPTAR
jgi:flagellar motility protein MotE (MotC chaperone)